MKLKSNIQVLAFSAIIFCVACTQYGTTSAKDSATVKAEGSNNGSGQGGSYRSPAEGNDSAQGGLKDNSVPRDSIARDSSAKVKSGRKP